MANRAIDRAIEHYQRTKGERHDIDTAWGFKVWVSPWTLGEKDRVFGSGGAWRHRDGARMLVVKAEDENGVRLFQDIEEKELLNEVDPDEITSISGRMLRLLNADNAAAREMTEGDLGTVATPKD